MPRQLVTPPTAEPITLAEAKQQRRVTTTADDPLIDGLIVAARDWAERFTGRALMTQTWDYFLDAFPDAIELQLPPLQSVTSVKYVDTNGMEQTLATTEYTVDAAAERGLVRPAFGKSWPATRAQANAITVRFVAGYASAAMVPASIKAGMHLVIGELYERREHSIVGTIIETVPLNAEYLLSPYRSIRF